MVGGLSLRYRVLIAAGATVVVGSFAHGPVNAADLGGDCCADLEERVAELEATTVRKGNKKVSVTLYGQVNKAGRRRLRKFSQQWPPYRVSPNPIGPKGN